MIRFFSRWRLILIQNARCYVIRGVHHLYFCLSHILYLGILQILLSCRALDHTGICRKVIFLCRERLWLYPSLSALHPGVYRVLSPTVPFLPPSPVVQGGGTLSRRPNSLNGPRPFRHLQLRYFTDKEIYGVWWWGCIESFEMVAPCPHVTVVVVLVCPHFPSLRYIYTLLISLMMSSYCRFYDNVLYILLLYRFTLKIFPGWKRWVELKRLRAGNRRKGSTRSERRKIKHALDWWGRDCRRGIWSGWPAAHQSLEHDSGDIKALWSQSIYRHVLLYIVDNVGRHFTDFGSEGLTNDLIFFSYQHLDSF